MATAVGARVFRGEPFAKQIAAPAFEQGNENAHALAALHQVALPVTKTPACPNDGGPRADAHPARNAAPAAAVTPLPAPPLVATAEMSVKRAAPGPLPVDPLIDRLGRYPHAPVPGMLKREPARDLFRRPVSPQARENIGAQAAMMPAAMVARPPAPFKGTVIRPFTHIDPHLERSIAIHLAADHTVVPTQPAANLALAAAVQQ